MIEAKVIADSVSPQGKRLTTFQLRYPKFIHGEFMTHRVISRNASSSRAIPTPKLIEEAEEDALRASFVFWGKNQPGMQAAVEFTGDDLKMIQDEWRGAARAAAVFARRMHLLGAHKQLVNRVLEPFSHINVVATATEWDNFFGLRLHQDAQPEMRALAVAMWEARSASTPVELQPDDWHLPYIRPEDAREYLGPGVQVIGSEVTGFGPPRSNETLIKVSVARCARVSYLSYETGKTSTVEEDLKLYEKLTAGLSDPTQPLHASPMEHQATPDEYIEVDAAIESYSGDGPTKLIGWQKSEEHGNLVGWRQYRKMLPNEAVAPLPRGYEKVQLNLEGPV